MSLLELLRLALSRLRTSRLRAALTMLGVIIGVASVVALVGVGQGTTSNITNRLASLGTNLLTISPTGGGASSGTLTLEDADAIGELGVGRRRRAGGLDEPARARPATKTHDDHDRRHDAGLPDGPRLRRLAGHVPDRRQRRPRPARGRPRRVDGRRTWASTASDLGSRDLASAASRSRSSASSSRRAAAGFQDPDDQVMVPVGAVQKYFVGGDTRPDHRGQRRRRPTR